MVNESGEDWQHEAPRIGNTKRRKCSCGSKTPERFTFWLGGFVTVARITPNAEPAERPGQRERCRGRGSRSRRGAQRNMPLVKL
ncbi:unnamed protein product [Lampetra planeri]